jgi:hypothetical protein
MNAKLIATAALTAFAATAALADDITVVPAAQSLKSRAEVQAEVLQARAQGTLIPAGEHITVKPAAQAAEVQKSRDQVRAEVLAARSAGTLLRAGEVLGGE